MHRIKCQSNGLSGDPARNSAASSVMTFRCRVMLMVFTFCVLTSEYPCLIAAEDAPAVIPLKHAHAHNDYLHPHPLFDALDQGFGSVEADIFLKDDQLLIGHEERDLKPGRTLESLYLIPLRERILSRKGWVYGPDFHFSLLIDVKTDANATYTVLDKTLTRYADILSVTQDGHFERKPVTIVLSGNRARDLITKQRVRYVGLDGRPEDLDSHTSAGLMPWISARWGSLFTWNGDGPLPMDERAKLVELVARAHQRGQRVRFWATPEKELVWKELLSANVDLINTDDLVGLRQFLRSQSPTP